MSAYECRVCRNTETKEQYVVREMMFGMRDEFVYDRCSSCLSIQIRDIPSQEVLWKYYPENYYSRVDDDGDAPGSSPKAALRHFAKKWRLRHTLGKFDLRGFLVSLVWPEEASILGIADSKV